MDASLRNYPLPYTLCKHLIHAVSTGDLESVKKHVPLSVHVNQPVTEYCGGAATYLSLLAVAHNKADILKFLLTLGADALLRDPVGMNIFSQAASMSYVSTDVIDVLLVAHNNGEFLNDQIPSTGNTALHLAVINKNAYVVQKLISMGSVVRACTIKNRCGDTPLGLSIKLSRGNPTIAIMLIKYAMHVTGESLSTTDKRGYTVLELAKMYDMPSVVATLPTPPPDDYVCLRCTQNPASPVHTPAPSEVGSDSGEYFEEEDFDTGVDLTHPEDGGGDGSFVHLVNELVTLREENKMLHASQVLDLGRQLSSIDLNPYHSQIAELQAEIYSLKAVLAETRQDRLEGEEILSLTTSLAEQTHTVHDLQASLDAVRSEMVEVTAQLQEEATRAIATADNHNQTIADIHSRHSIVVHNLTSNNDAYKTRADICTKQLKTSRDELARLQTTQAAVTDQYDTMSTHFNQRVADMRAEYAAERVASKTALDAAQHRLEQVTEALTTKADELDTRLLTVTTNRDLLQKQYNDFVVASEACDRDTEDTHQRELQEYYKQTDKICHNMEERLATEKQQHSSALTDTEDAYIAMNKAEAAKYTRNLVELEKTHDRTVAALKEQHESDLAEERRWCSTPVQVPGDRAGMRGVVGRLNRVNAANKQAMAAGEERLVTLESNYQAALYEKDLEITRLQTALAATE